MSGLYASPTFAQITVTVEERTLTSEQLVVELADGNDGAVSAIVCALVCGILEAIWTERKPEEWLLSVWSSRLRGDDLLIAYRDECNGDTATFVELIEKLAAAGGAR